MKHAGLLLALLVLIILTVISCVNPTAPAPAVAPTDAAAPTKTLYFLAANNSDPFYVPGVAGFTAGATAAGYKAEFVGPLDLNVAAQVQTLEQIAANPNAAGVFIYAIDYNALRPATEAARARGLPIVNGSADSPYKARNAFVGYDNGILGVQAAEAAMQLIDGKGKVGTIGVSGASVIQRRESFAAHIGTNYPDVEVVDTAMHDGSASDAEKQLDAYLAANPDLTLLWWADGVSGQMAQIWREKQQAGAKTLFLATDMPEATLKAVQEGVFAASVGQDTYTEEYWGAQLLAALAAGQRVPDTLYLSTIIVTKDNVADYLPSGGQ